MIYDFRGNFVTYLVQYAKNKIAVKFPPNKKTASKKGVTSRIVSRAATSTHDVSQFV